MDGLGFEHGRRYRTFEPLGGSSEEDWGSVRCRRPLGLGEIEVQAAAALEKLGQKEKAALTFFPAICRDVAAWGVALRGPGEPSHVPSILPIWICQTVRDLSSEGSSSCPVRNRARERWQLIPEPSSAGI